MAHKLSTEWAPYVDPKTGEVVTLTWEQVNAVLHAVRVVNDLRANNVRVFPQYPNVANKCPPLEQDVPAKSRALGRLLIEGKALYEEVPPHDLGAAAYWIWDAENDGVEIDED